MNPRIVIACWGLPLGCGGTPVKLPSDDPVRTDSAAPDSATDSAIPTLSCADQLALLDGEWVPPSRVVPACEPTTGRTFRDVATEWGLVPPVEARGDHNKGGVVAVEDFDQDGILDVVFGYSGAELVHFVGTGSGFSSRLIAGTEGTGPLVSFDLDADGDLDLVSLGPPVVILDNEAGTLVPRTLEVGIGAPIVDVSPADFDGDGHIDLYMTSSGEHTGEPSSRTDRLFLGDGTGRFTSVDLELPDAGGLGFDALAADLNGDGTPDVYAVNDFGTTVGPNVLWHNNGGILVSQNDVCACDLAISGMGVDAGDVDGDGLVELLIASTGANHLLQQAGDGIYVDVALSTGADALRGLPTMAWGQVFFDYDDDGKLDIVVAEGDLWLASTDPELRISYDGPLHLMANVGTRAAPSFQDVADTVGLDGLGSWRAVVPADFDADGRVDLLITDVVGPPRLLLAEGCTGHGAIEVDAPLHTRVEACIADERHVGWVRAESGWGGSGPHLVRMGTGTHPAPDAVLLVPPGVGAR